MRRHYRYAEISEFTIVVLTMWVIYGALLFTGGFFDSWSPSTALRWLPNHLELLIGAFIATGGAFALRGALSKRYLVSEAWSLEIVGLILGGCGWFANGLATLLLTPFTPLPYVVGFFMSGAAIWRTWTIWHVAKRTRHKALDSREER